MHRRMSLGVGFLLLLFLLIGAVSAVAEPLAASEPAAAGSFDVLLDQVWEWLASLLGGDPPGGPNPGGGPQEGLNGDGGVFIDPWGGQ